jgi:kynureninase
VIAMSALDAALDVWQDVDISQVREKSIALADVFIKLVQTHSCLSDFRLCSTENSSQRGSQLAFSHTDAFAICQALIEKGVIADFRAPNILRFGFTPLYTSFEEIWQAVAILAEVVKSQLYTQPRFNLAGKVT